MPTEAAMMAALPRAAFPKEDGNEGGGKRKVSTSPTVFSGDAGDQSSCDLLSMEGLRVEMATLCIV